MALFNQLYQNFINLKFLFFIGNLHNTVHALYGTCCVFLLLASTKRLRIHKPHGTPRNHRPKKMLSRISSTRVNMAHLRPSITSKGKVFSWLRLDNVN